MPMKTPSFWYSGTASFLSLLLRPLLWLYALGYFIHQRSVKPKRVGVPVICVGNLVAGGTGKTPSAISIMGLIKTHKLAETPFFLTRGYGGDEDKILSEHALTIVSANRFAGAQEAVARNTDLILMDDGMQNPGLHKDTKFVVVDGTMGFGNEHMLPAGPLRQPLKKGLEQADAFIFIGKDRRNVTPLLSEKPVFKANFKALKDLSNTDKYIAFAGLGYPQKFFNFLRDSLEDRLVDTIAFADHHPYSANDLQSLRERAMELGATLITTEKDAARLSPKDDDIEVLPVTLEWEDEAALVQFLKDRVKP